MNLKDSLPSNIEGNISESALAALESSAGSRVIGGGASGISVGDVFTVNSIDYQTGLVPPRGMSTKTWNNLSDSEKKEKGVERSWFTFLTNNGNLSFGAILGQKDMYETDYWKAPEKDSEESATTVVEVADGFDVTKIFKPSARVPLVWVKAGCDKLIGKTVKCVGIKQYRPAGQTFDVRVRAFEVVG